MNKNNNFDSNGRLEWIDVLKCIVMYLVVVGHAIPVDQNTNLGWYIYSFHMPLFFIISGMTFYLQCSKKSFTLHSLAINKTKSILWPYIAFSLLALPLWLFNFRVISRDSERRILELLYGILYSNEEEITSTSNAMWFLPTLFLAIIAFWIIMKWSKDNDKYLILMVGIIACFGYANSVRISEFYSPWHIDTVPIAILCLMIGWLLMKYIEQFNRLIGDTKRQIMLVILLIATSFIFARMNDRISMALNTYGSFLLFLLVVVGFGTVCIIIAKWLPPLSIFKFIGRNTVVILAFHSPIFRTLERWSETTKIMIYDYPVITATLVFILLIPICWIVEKCLPFLLGRPYGKFAKSK